MIVTLADPYLAQNAGRRYPLADDTTGLSNTSLLDFRCTIREGVSDSVPTATLTSLSDETVESQQILRITVTLSSGTTVHGILSFDIPKNMASDDPFTAVSTASAISGALTVSSSVLHEITGSYAIPFSPTTVIRQTLAVDSIQAVTNANDEPAWSSSAIYIQGDTVSKDGVGYVCVARHVETVGPASWESQSTYWRRADTVVTGKIMLANGYNADPYLDGNNLRLDIYKGAGIGERCQQAAAGQTCENVLFTINGERPGSDGELHLVGENGITVTPDAAHNALEIRLDSVSTDRMAKTCGTVC